MRSIMSSRSSLVFLRPNVLFEPVVNHWYASSFLISPVTAAMYLANVQVKIMESFLLSPQTHLAASQNPAMIGGPFIHYGPERVSEIRQLLERSKTDEGD